MVAVCLWEAHIQRRRFPSSRPLIGGTSYHFLIGYRIVLCQKGNLRLTWTEHKEHPLIIMASLNSKYIAILLVGISIFYIEKVMPRRIFTAHSRHTSVSVIHRDISTVAIVESSLCLPSVWLMGRPSGACMRLRILP